MLTDEIKANDTVTFKVSKIFENPEGIKMFKFGEYYLTEDALNKMGISSIITATCSPFDRAEKDETYYLIDVNGKVCDSIETYHELDKELYNAGNYCTDEKLLYQRAMHETLNRLLWRYSEEHGGDNERVWNSSDYGYQKHWYIYFNHIQKNFCWAYNDTHESAGTVYFVSEEIAQNAVRDIVQPFIEKHPDFKW